jgi:hypothetical protein
VRLVTHLPPFVAALCLLLASTAPGAEDERRETSCVQCHGNIDLIGRQDYVDIVARRAVGVHAAVGLSCQDCHGGDPSPDLGADPAAAMSPEFVSNPFRGSPARPQIPDFCGRCHSDPTYMKRFKPDARVDQEKEYWTSQHGKLLRQGDTKVATCVDCHGVHEILRPTDSQAPVYPTHVAATCGACHSDPRHMAGYTQADGSPLPVDQYQRWMRSVHADALLRREDLSAPTCNNCHGNHGAAPPGLESIVFVCGQCHGREATLFRASPKHQGFQRHNQDYLPAMDGAGCAQCHESQPLADITRVRSFSECATCHGKHAVMRPTVALLAPLPSTPCAFCHEGPRPVAEPYQEPEHAQRLYEKARDDLLAEGRKANVQGDALFDWLVGRTLEMSAHTVSGERGSGQKTVPRPEFERLFRNFRIGETHYTYRDPVSGREIRQAVVRCTDCHGIGTATDKGQSGYDTSKAFLDGMYQVTALTARAERLLLTAERGGVAVGKARNDLDHAVDAQIQLEALVHTFSAQPEGEFSKTQVGGTKHAQAAIRAGRAALAELAQRRRGLAVSLVIILLVLIGLGLKIRARSGQA